MKNSENNKSLLRRYLDDLYTMDDARKLLMSYRLRSMIQICFRIWLLKYGKKLPCNHRRQTLNANNIKKRRDCY